MVLGGHAGAPAILGSYVAGGEQLIPIADGNGAPVVSGGLVVWAQSWSGPFVASDIPSGSKWPVSTSMTGAKLTGLALSGRTLVWGRVSDASGSGVVAAVDVDGGAQQTVASGISGLVGPSYDGRTIVWAERVGDAPTAIDSAHPYGGFRVMGRHLADSRPFLVAEVADPVTEVAVSGDTVRLDPEGRRLLRDRPEEDVAMSGAFAHAPPRAAPARRATGSCCSS